MDARLRHELNEAERRAWDALATRRYLMFGHWAQVWARLNWAGGFRRPSPFKYLENLAQARQAGRVRALARLGIGPAPTEPA